MVSKTKLLKELEKNFVALLLLRNHEATISGMFKSGGSAKTVYIQFIVAYAIIYMKLVIFFYGSVFIM